MIFAGLLSLSGFAKEGQFFPELSLIVCHREHRPEELTDSLSF
jgi:hypothetical protein